MDIGPQLRGAELITLTVRQALGYVSEACSQRCTRKHLHRMFPGLPGQPGYDQRLRDLADRDRQLLISDKNYYGRDFETALAANGLIVLRPAGNGEPARTGDRFFKPLRQILGSVIGTFKGQLDLEGHGGHTPLRHLARILALTVTIWCNNHTGQQVMRSLTAYDH